MEVWLFVSAGDEVGSSVGLGVGAGRQGGGSVSTVLGGASRNDALVCQVP